MEQKKAPTLPSFKVANNETFEAWIAVKVDPETTLPQVRVALTKDEAKDPVFLKFKVTLLRWTWPLRAFLYEQSMVLDTVSGQRILSQQMLAENKLRFLLLEWTVPGDTGQPSKLKRDMSANGRTQLTQQGLNEVLSYHPDIIQAVLTQLNRVLEYGESPRTIEADIVKGQETIELLPRLGKLFAAMGFNTELSQTCIDFLTTEGAPLELLAASEKKKEAEELGKKVPPSSS